MADIVFPGQAGQVANASALPSNYDLVVYKGDYLELFVNITDAGGSPIDLTGATPKAVLKSDYSDRNPIPFTTAVSGTGQVSLLLSSAQTSQLLPGSYIWDFQVTTASGQTRTYIAGDVTVYNEVTQ